MDIYLYCSYTGARLGFTLSRLGEGGLEPVSLRAGEGPEKLIRDFFFYDRFRALWLEYPISLDGCLGSGPAGAVFGLRSLRGRIGERDGTANFMVRAGREELEELEGLARGVMAAPAAFAGELFDRLFVGGECGYQAQAGAMEELFDLPPAKSALDELVTPPYRERRLPNPRLSLRLAVYIGAWEQACAGLTPALLWRQRPRQAVSESELRERYGVVF